ncbi:hypothetical protein M9Y10_004256 [Tritrichomonas musculus]|uniref:USP domain-containing protein n=1 Tax=Tritrichomonas musculus TaxID=1915356 RepID=A0ABR2JRZ4_9EUKA
MNDEKNDILQIEKGYIKPFGLKNIGNSCYQNSAFQCLFSLPTFVKNLDSLISKSENPKLLVEIKNYICDPLHDPTKIRAFLGKKDSIYQSFSQSDSYMLILVIIDSIHDENKKMIDDLFYGKFTNQIINNQMDILSSCDQFCTSINFSIKASQRILYIPYSITQHTIRFARLPKVSETVGFEDENIEKATIKPFLLMRKANSKYENIDQISPEYSLVYAFELPEKVKDGFGLVTVQLETPEKKLLGPPFLCEVPLGQNDENQLKKIVIERIKELFTVPINDEIEATLKLKEKISSFNFSEKPPFCIENVNYIVSDQKLIDNKKRSKKPSDDVISIPQLFNGHIAYNPLISDSQIKSFQRVKYTEFPQILVMQIQRGFKLIKGDVTCNSKIFIPQKISVTTDGEFNRMSSNVDELKNGLQYELRAFTDHIGTLNEGHFTAFAKRGENWYHFNDSKVTQIPEITEPSTTACTVFYQRINNDKQE